MPDPVAPASPDLPTVVETLARAGLDLVRPFDGARYNEVVTAHPTLRPLHLFGRPRALALVIGNSRRLWPAFVQAYRSKPELREAPDPLDLFVSEAIAHAAANLSAAHTVHLAHEEGAARVSMLHAAQVSGLAHLGPAHLAVHPVHGPWIGLRAVLVIDAPPPPEAPAAPSPCAGCAAPCRDALDGALAKLGTTPEVQGDIASTWRSWVAVRDACPIGHASRYPEEQLRYHYTKDRSALVPSPAARPEEA